MSARPRSSLRVLHCRSSAGRFGPEQSLAGLLPALSTEGVEPLVLLLHRRRPGEPETHPWVHEARDLGIAADQISDPGPLSLAVLRALERAIRQAGAAVLHTHDYKTNVLGGLAARRVDGAMPWVATVHLHTTTSRRLRLYRALDLFLLRLADRVVAVSRDQRRLLLARGVDRRRLVLVPNTIDADAFAAGAGDRRRTRAGIGVPEQAQLVTLVGRLTPQKGVDCLIEASVLLRDRFPAARFVVAGEGPDREALETACARAGLDGVVMFLGYRRDVAALLAASEVAVLPSRAEGLPIVLLEAMSVGLPVVAANVGGVPDLVVDGSTGVLVPPDSPRELAGALATLLADPVLARAMGARGASHVRRHYAPRVAARRVASIYRTVLAERAP